MCASSLHVFQAVGGGREKEVWLVKWRGGGGWRVSELGRDGKGRTKERVGSDSR